MGCMETMDSPTFFGTDNGPSYPSCGGTVYTYRNFEGEGQARCMGCHAAIRWPQRRDNENWQAFKVFHCVALKAI